MINSTIYGKVMCYAGVGHSSALVVTRVLGAQKGGNGVTVVTVDTDFCIAGVEDTNSHVTGVD